MCDERHMTLSVPYEIYNAYVEHVREAAATWFSEHQCHVHVRMPYCLEWHGLWPQNIICDNVLLYLLHERSMRDNAYSLKKYLHHGLSSQAMLFNLIGPLIATKEYAPLEEALAMNGINWSGATEAHFEYGYRTFFKESEQDDATPTSTDAVFLGGDRPLFLKATLAEKDFGGCSVGTGCYCPRRNPYPDRLEECSLWLIDQDCWRSMEDVGFMNTPLFQGPLCPMADHYHFLREAAFAFHHNGLLILLHDERNPLFQRKNPNGKLRGLWPFLVSMLPEQWRSSTGIISIQQLVSIMESHDEYKDWLPLFKKKYGLDRAIA